MEGFCRACLNKLNESTELFQYCETNRRLFVYCTGLQVKRNDTFTFQLCKECYLNVKFACKFKKQCRTSDKKIKSYLALKRDGECIDFSAYLKNIEDTLTLRLPITSSSSTPVHQKNYDDDDDNVSTCTSIQNFMSDMLQGEEMLPTEARIIREVIQEEADIMDDSLDSHWLQDDMSVDNDFGMDFNFAGFSTPHSINNDHCYTPRRLTDDKADDMREYYYTPKNPIQKYVDIQMAHDQKDMPLIEIGENNTVNCEYAVKIDHDKKEMILNQNDMPMLDDCDIEFDGIVEDKVTMRDLRTEYNNECIENANTEHITVILNKGVASKVVDSPLTNELEFYMNKVELNKMSSIKPGDIDRNKLQSNENNIDTVYNQSKVDAIINQSSITQDHYQCINNDKFNLDPGKYIENIESPVKCELEKYITEVELKKNVNGESNLNKHFAKKCSIDKNLEIALKNDDSQEFSLDQLLISPQVSLSGASTPTINNILFGNLTPREACSVAPLEITTVIEPTSTDFIEEFLKDDRRQSTPKKGLKGKRSKISVKDLNNLKESKLKAHKSIFKGGDKGSKGLKRLDHKINKSQNTKNRGYKDIRRLKDLFQFNNENNCVTDSEQSLSTIRTIDEEINEFETENFKETSEFEKENLNETSEFEKENLNETSEFEKENHNETSEFEKENHNESEEFENDNLNETLDSETLDGSHQSRAIENIPPVNQFPKNNEDDLDISISNLLNFDDSKSVDLNISIASDFLKDENLDGDNSAKDPEFVFKMPFSPPDNKYDLDQVFCKICDKMFGSKCALKMHFVKVHKQNLPKEKRKIAVPKICPKCGKGFQDTSNFNKHMKQHEDPDNFKCEYCTLDFATRGRFKKHLRSHVNEIANKEKKVLIINEQNEDVSNKTKKLKEDGKVGKTFVCTTCGKVFKTVGNFNLHVRRHTKSYSMKCTLCQKGFFRKYDLDVHMASHNKVHQFACEYCSKTYRSRYFLVGHMYKHLGKDKFECEVCDRKFISKQYLQQHYKTVMCVNNRKASEEKRETDVVTVTYKPIKYESSITKCAEENVTEVEAVETLETKTDSLKSTEEEKDNLLSNAKSK